MKMLLVLIAALNIIVAIFGGYLVYLCLVNPVSTVSIILGGVNLVLMFANIYMAILNLSRARNYAAY